MDLWNQQIGLADDCLRACVFGDYIMIRRPPPDSAWRSIADICYSDAVITWNQLFGQRSQETHWTKFVSQLKIPKGDKLKPFGKEMIIQFLDISEDEWNKYHHSMVAVRNLKVAHLNVNQPVDELPNVTNAMHCAYLYRDWLMEAMLLANRMGYNFKVDKNRAKDCVNIYKGLIEKACKGI